MSRLSIDPKTIADKTNTKYHRICLRPLVAVISTPEDTNKFPATPVNTPKNYSRDSFDSSLFFSDEFPITLFTFFI